MSLQIRHSREGGNPVSKHAFRNRLKAWIPAFAGMTALGLSGCVTRQDIRGIQTDLYSIQKGIETRLGNVKDQTDSVQTSQADLLQEIRDLSGNLTSLKAELNDYQQRMAQLSTRLDDLEASLTARMDSQIELLSGSKFVEKPSPSTTFNLANTDFSRGKYSEAITGFNSYIKQFPKADKVPEARLKIGDSLAKQKDSDAAIAAYDALVQDYPKNALAGTALMRKASLLESVGKRALAISAYSAVVKSFPYSNEAKTAQDRVRSLQAEQK